MSETTTSEEYERLRALLTSEVLSAEEKDALCRKLLALIVDGEYQQYDRT
jgi:hypothetical protein